MIFINDSNKTLKKIIAILSVCVILVAILILVGVLIFISTSGSGRRINENSTELTSEESENDKKSASDDIPLKTTFAIYGVDKGGALADVIIVGVFDKNKNTINTISVPRDTFVKMPQYRISELSENGHWVPSDGMKINAVHSYAGELGNEYLTLTLEDLLNVHIDYYYEVDLNGFIEIVDAVGGVEIDVPSRMYYSDPTQNLLINIKKGPQRLDGKTAQGFVRFRQYIEGDIERIEMQKLFIKSLFSEIIKKENILTNILSYINIFIDNVETNMTISDAIDYIPYIRKISSSDITMETLPGDGNTPYNHDIKATKILVNKLFYDIEPQTEAESETEETTEEETE